MHRLNSEHGNRRSVRALMLAVLLGISCNEDGRESPTAPPSPSPTPPTPPPLCLLSNTPKIAFDFIPPRRSEEPIRGSVSFTVTPCDSTRFRVALYIHVPGYSPRYICKPFQAAPLTPINANGLWQARYATGGRDLAATKFWAFLVSSDFQGQCFINRLPQVNGRTVFAEVSASR